MPDAIGCIKLPVNRLHLELTNICNFSCEFCPDSKMTRKRGMMPIENAKAIIDQVAEKDIAKSIFFHVMGEPTLYPHLVDVAAHANRKGIATCLTTNGSRLDIRLLSELVDAGVDRIIISLQTPHEETFSLRGTRGLTFGEYSENILNIARQFMTEDGKSSLTISFLSSPLRRLIIPIYPEVSIADTSKDLKKHLQAWADRIIKGSATEGRRSDIAKQIRRICSFRENVVYLSDRLSFRTRIMGDWSIHFDRTNVEASFGYCPAIQDNFGILWNGDYTFCCTDFDGATSTGNVADMPIADYLRSDEVQRTVKGFSRFRVLHKHCRQCLGDKNLLNAIVKQLGSICYFKFLRKGV